MRLRALWLVSGVFAVLIFLVPSFLSLSSSAQTLPGVKARITQPIDEAQLVRLERNTHPNARPEFDQGAVDDGMPMEKIILQLQRSAEQQLAFNALVEDLHNPKSPLFHQWLTPQQIGQNYGPSDADIATITGWLGSHGFKIDFVATGRTHIVFSGTAGQVRDAFHTEIHNYVVKGEHHVANATAPMIPAALSGVVSGFRSLHDFYPHPMFRKKAPINISFSHSGAEQYNVGPQDFYKIYGENALLTSGITGAGQTIAVIEETDITTTDVTTFRSQFGLATYPATPNSTAGGVNYITGPTGCTNPGILSDGEEPEADIDVQWTGVTAPNAIIDFVACASTSATAGIDLSASYVINSLSSTVSSMSLSYGVCETELTGTGANAIYQPDSYYNTLWQQAAAEGQTVVVSSGDSGSEGCDQDETASSTYFTHGTQVSGMESTPYNVSAGGTDFSDTFNGTNSTYWNTNDTSPYLSALSYVPETPWASYCSTLTLAYENNSGQDTGDTLPVFCTAFGDNEVVGGSGGPSNCATGTPSTAGYVTGTCAGYAKPAWQSMYGVPSDGVRDVPDLSFFAANGFWSHILEYCDSAVKTCLYSNTTDAYDLTSGGTSFVAPMINGIMALVNQKTGYRQGQADYTLYALAANEFGTTSTPNTTNLTNCNANLGNTIGSTCTFYDIGPTTNKTAGGTVAVGNMQPCEESTKNTFNCYNGTSTVGVSSTSTTSEVNAYSSTAGYDYATGIGSANITNLVNNWTSVSSVNEPQTVTFPNPGTQTYGVSPITLTAAASSGLAVTYSVTSGPASVSGSTLTITGAGTVIVAANQAGNSTYASTTVSDTFTVSKAAQTITFPNPGTQTFGVAPITLTATASSGLAVSYSVTSGPASVNGSTLTITGAGTVIVAASQSGGTNYNAATTVSDTFTVNKGTPTTSFTGAPTSASSGGTFTVTATTNASTTPTIAGTANVCTVGAVTGNAASASALVTITASTGTCTTTASWATDTNYVAATKTQTTSVAGKQNPTVTFTGAPVSAAYQSTFTVASTTNASTTAVISSSGACSNSGTSVTMTSGTGTCSLTATWAADSNYNSATANQSTSATKIAPITTFTGAPVSSGYGSNFSVASTTNASTTAVIGSSGACSNSGNSVSMTSGTGTCSLTATWAADSNYNSATANQSTGATKGTPTTTFTGAPVSAAFATSFSVSSTTTASTTAVIGSSGACSNTGNSVSMTSGTGTCSLTATWAADSNYNSATANQSTTALMIAPTVTFTGAPSIATTGQTFTVAETSNSSSTPVVSSSGACSNSGNSVTMIANTGTCSLTASWASDGNYTTATATQSTTAASPGIYSPASGSTLPGYSQTFSWLAYPGATAYWLDLGSSQGAGTYLDSGSLSSSTLSYSVTTLPQDGSTVWARWFYQINGAYQYIDYSYTATGGIPNGDSAGVISSPTSGSSLSGSSVVFTWTPGTGVTAYELDLGSAAGGQQYFQSGSQGSGVTSVTATGLPTDGSQVYATLYSTIGSYTYSTSASYTAYSPSSGAAAMQTPVPGSALTGSTVTFTWSTGAAATAYWLDAGSSQGGNGYYQSGSIPGTTVTVSGLPTDGSTVYVTLYSLVSGSWAPINYTYTAFSASSAAGVLTSPNPGSVLDSTSITFSWTAGSSATAYWLDLGSTAGGNQIFQSGNLGNVLTVTASGLPANGSPIYATLYSYVNGAWVTNSYLYTAYTTGSGLGAMATPTPGSQLSGTTVQFTWTAGSASTAYWLDIGSSAGGNNYYQSGNLGNVLTTSASGLPSDGSSTVYVTLYSYVGGSWQSSAYTYIAFNPNANKAVMSSPVNGAQLSGSTQVFNWTPAANATAYWLDLGSSVGGNDIYQSGNLGTATTATATGVPTDGSTLYATLYSYVNGAWISNAYTYTTGP